MRDGRILGAGSLEELEGWGDYELDETFKDKIIMPGLVEGHSHAMEGTLWRYTYLGSSSDPPIFLLTYNRNPNATHQPLVPRRLCLTNLRNLSTDVPCCVYPL